MRNLLVLSMLIFSNSAFADLLCGDLGIVVKPLTLFVASGEASISSTGTIADAQQCHQDAFIDSFSDLNAQLEGWCPKPLYYRANSRASATFDGEYQDNSYDCNVEDGILFVCCFRTTLPED